MPEEVHWARLTAEPAGELLERPVDPTKRLPVALDRGAIIRGVLGVLGEWRGHRNPEWHGLDLRLDPEPGQEREQTLVESGDRETVGKWNGVDLPAARAHDKLVGNEVEGHVEVAALGAKSARGQPSCFDVKRCVPPVVLQWRRSQSHLADDLRPEMERFFRQLPLLELKLRQIAHDLVSARSTRNLISSSLPEHHSSPGSRGRTTGPGTCRGPSFASPSLGEHAANLRLTPLRARAETLMVAAPTLPAMLPIAQSASGRRRPLRPDT
jgi:hypothetical protein